MPDLRRSLPLLAALALTLPAAAGPLDPPAGPVTPTGATVQQIKDAVDAARADVSALRVDPRIDVNALPSISTGLHGISAPGSYVLTANITAGGSEFTGIFITADNVTIDLNGFTISGDGASGYGIVLSNTRRNVTIRNGVIRNFGLAGISASNDEHMVIENLTIEDCGQSAILAGDHSTLRNIIVRASASNGIAAGAGSIVADCISTNNGSSGISVAEGSTVTGCVASDNASDGIQATDACTIRDNNCRGNTSDGIQGANRNNIQDNTCDSNGLSAGVSGYGVNVTGSFNRIEGNQLTQDDASVRFGATGNLFIRNTLTNNGLLYAGTGDNLIATFSTSVGSNPLVNFVLE